MPFPPAPRRALPVAIAALLCAWLIPAALTAPPASAQSCSPSCSPMPGGMEAPETVRDPLAALSAPATDDVAALVDGAAETCGALPDPRYRIDCLRLMYARAAHLVPATGDYAPVRQALLDAARKLDGIVAANLDPAAPTVRPLRKGAGEARLTAPVRTAPVRAIAEDRLATAAAAAGAVIEETGLLILRSGGRPPRRAAHYQQIAAALDGTMVLLRSG